MGNIAHPAASQTARAMKPSETTDQRLARMTLASVYPLYLAKVERKGRTKAELDQVILWLTGINAARLAELMQEKADFEQVFSEAQLNPAATQITGTICGVRVEDIANPLTRHVRYLDKLVDELAKGRAMAKVLRRQSG
jgi:hypothetical protein